MAIRMSSVVSKLRKLNIEASVESMYQNVEADLAYACAVLTYYRTGSTPHPDAKPSRTISSFEAVAFLDAIPEEFF